jgi:hypothetical protein
VPRGRQRTDSTHVLGAVRAVNRLGCAIETRRAALNALATVAPEWRRARADPAWPERHARGADEYHIPQGEAARQACAEQVGRDGHLLLAVILAQDAPRWLREIPAVELLRCVWVENFSLAPADTGPKGGAVAGEPAKVRWRTTADGLPPALRLITSPYDPDGHFAQKRSTKWIGYKAQLTETCDDERPNLITHVETTPAPVVDRDALGRVHQALGASGLLPGTHLVGAGYIDVGQLVASVRAHGIELIGPARKDQQGQARTAGAFTVRDFKLDGDRRIATCPTGHTSHSWTATDNQGRTVMRRRFSTTDGKPCALKPRCTRTDRRRLMPRQRAEHAFLAAARTRETEPTFAASYQRRAGIEGTLSQAVRVMHLRRARSIGLAKTHLQHVRTAAAMNLVRLGTWLAGEPRAQTRLSAFARLMAQPAPA